MIESRKERKSRKERERASTATKPSNYFSTTLSHAYCHRSPSSYGTRSFQFGLYDLDKVKDLKGNFLYSSKEFTKTSLIVRKTIKNKF